MGIYLTVFVSAAWPGLVGQEKRPCNLALQCAVCNVLCAVCSVQCAVCSVQFGWWGSRRGVVCLLQPPQFPDLQPRSLQGCTTRHQTLKPDTRQKLPDNKYQTPDCKYQSLDCKYQTPCPYQGFYLWRKSLHLGELSTFA